MHQSIPAAPSSPPHPPPAPGLLRGICPPFYKGGGWAFANFALPGGRAFANPGAICELLIRTQFPSEYNYIEDITWKIADHVAHLSRTGGCKGMFSILCMQFFIAYQARITKRNSGAIDVNQRFLVSESNFCWYYLKKILWYLSGSWKGGPDPHSRLFFARIPHSARFSSVSRIPLFFPRKIH